MIAGKAYQARFNPPGGVWDDDKYKNIDSKKCNCFCSNIYYGS